MVHGEMIYKEGAKYIGGFKNGKMSGQGSLKTSSLEIDGEFEDDYYNGHAFSNIQTKNMVVPSKVN